MSDNAINLQFQQLYELIQSARNRALFAVNREHLQLYWQVGAFIHGRLTEENWGEKVVEQFSEWLNEKDPTVKILIGEISTGCGSFSWLIIMSSWV